MDGLDVEYHNITRLHHTRNTPLTRSGLLVLVGGVTRGQQIFLLQRKMETWKKM
jgi:hypothetical protein